MTLRSSPLSAALLSAGAISLSVALPAHAQTAPPASATAMPSTTADPSNASQKKPSATPATAASSHDEGALPTVQVNGAADKDAFAADTSTVGAKVPTALRDIPQQVTVINRSLLESQGATSFSDALRNAPGVTIGAAEGGTIGNNVNLRGFTARTDIYLDGFRDRGQYYRDTFDLESIEVLYGPSSMLFGRGSTGGVINQVSKQAQLTPVSEVSATIGSNDRYRTTVDLDRPLSDTSAFRINAFGQSMGSTRDIEKMKDFGFAPEISFGIGTPTEVTLSALIQHNDDQPDYGVQSINGHPADVDKGTFYGQTTDRTIQDTEIVSGRITHRFNDNVTLRDQLQYSHYTVDARETAPQSVLTGPLASSPALSNGNYTNLPLSDLYIKLQSHDRVITDSSLYNTTDLLTKFDTGGIKHDVVTGIEIGHDNYTNQSYTRSNLPIVSLVDPQITAWDPATSPEVAGNYANAGANSIGIYANDTVSLGEHWKVVGGLRWDRYQAEISNTVSAPGYAAQTNDFTSVRGGIIWQPTDTQSYYASYGTSFDPSLETLTVTSGTQNLAPEKNRSYEVGAKWDLLGGNLSVTSSLFQIEQTNSRTETDTGVYELTGDIRVNGFQTGIAGNLTDKWKVYGGYTYLDALVVSASDGTQGHTPANTPRNTLTLWSTYEPLSHWEVGGGLTYLSSRYAANTNYVSVGGYTRWDATLAYRRPKYDIRVNLLNLTNKYYYDALIPSDGGRAVPGIGRTVLVTGTYRF
ncbi:TonB-dependent siderophore receptor [Pararobbsia silviterrae]|uniref:TonB-dependent siderophore receptor n=1 Tax=Pararobbsia silviterrae TaxID=1792498 RepID=A0A494Y8H7_9BURK|nr:TonB-dependent siderophore receptor [Pararobbsia silviterrae]RKP58435.1 TonB-dependent siderophore receptor [Pararobbsia silviterrae]